MKWLIEILFVHDAFVARSLSLIIFWIKNMNKLTRGGTQNILIQSPHPPTPHTPTCKLKTVNRLGNFCIVLLGCGNRVPYFLFSFFMEEG